MATSESKTLMIAVVALVAFAGMMVWMLAGPGEEAAPEELATESPPPALPAAAPQSARPTAVPAATAPAAAPAAAAPSDSDVFAGTMPDFMVDLHAAVLDKKWLDSTQQRALYEFGKEHKDDARPQLLLAWDSMNREWDGIAVRMYRIAWQADHRAKDDPSMMRDLLSIARRHDRVEFRETTEIMKMAYGASAIPRIEEEIAKAAAAGDVSGATRLGKLRDALRAN